MKIDLCKIMKELTPVLGSPTPVLVMKVKQGESVLWLFLKIKPTNNHTN